MNLDDFAPLILGRPKDSDHRFEADIISGPFDADKLDYFPRDGHATGIEMSFDIERLLHCLEIQTVTDECKSSKSLVSNRGGYNALQQLLFARATLFSTVYHHQKVRACDCMVKAFVECQRQNKCICAAPCNPHSRHTYASAADFLGMTDYSFFTQASCHESKCPVAVLTQGLLSRELLKRILTVSSNTVVDADTEGPQGDMARAACGEFRNLREEQSKLRALSVDVWRAAGIEFPDWYVWFDLPKKPSLDKAGKARINNSPRNARPNIVKMAKIIPIEEWVRTYDVYYSQGYLFGPSNVEARFRLACAALIRLRSRPYRLSFYSHAVAEDIRDRIIELGLVQDEVAAVS